jgi:hypothetical protein
MPHADRCPQAGFVVEIEIRGGQKRRIVVDHHRLLREAGFAAS